MSTYTTSERYKRVKKQYRYKVAVGIPTSLVDAAPYAAKLRRAVELGWTIHGLENLVDVSDHTMHDVMAGAVASIERRTAAAIATLPDTYAVPAAMPDDAFVPSQGAVRRLRALLALGWTRADVQAAVTRRAPGVNISHLAADLSPRIKAMKWRAVAEVYDELCMTPGSSTLGRKRARKAGHIPPLGWTDIDDPDEQPGSVIYIPSGRAEQIRDVVEMGLGISEACGRLHVNRKNLERYCQRNGLRAEYEALAKVERRHDNQHTREAS